jgi:hypothetical protein
MEGRDFRRRREELDGYRAKEEYEAQAHIFSCFTVVIVCY